jgi:CRP/FNR family transcriptional regulator
MPQTSATEERALEALASVPIFARLDDKSLRKLARLCTLKSFQAGDVLHEEGAMALSLLIVTSGQVEVHKGAGDQKIALETVSAGGVLGHLALLNDQPRDSGAVAVEPTECLLLTRDSFDTLVKKDPEIAWCLTPALADRVRELRRLTVEAKQGREATPTAKAAEKDAGAPRRAAAEPAPAAADESGGTEAKADEDDEDDDSDVASAMFKMMRMQYGVMAGTAKGMTEMARTMETFLDSMAEETDLVTSHDWGGLLQRVPEAMATATREALDEAGKAPKEMMDAFRRYSEAKS